MNSSSKEIKAGAVLSYFSIGLSILSGLLLTPWIISGIGQSQFGLYTLANSLITLFLVDFGLGSATARYLSCYVADGEDNKIENFLGVIYKLYIAVDALILVIFVFIYFMMDHLYPSLSLDDLFQLKVVYVVAASFNLMNFPFVTLNGILLSHERFIHLKLADIVHRIMFIVLTLVVLSLGGGLFGLVIVNALSGLTSTAYKLLVVKKTISVRANLCYWNRSLCKEIFSFSAWSTLTSLAQRLIFNITPSILGAFASVSSIAVFGIVTTIEGYVYLLTNAINGLFLPRVSRICASRDSSEQIMPLVLSVGSFQYLVNGLIVAGFALVGKDFILLWMGVDFETAYYGILLIVMPGLFLNPLQIGNTIMVVKGKVKVYALIILLTGIVNVFLSIPLSAEMGVLGACAAISIAYILRAGILNIFYLKVLGLDMAKFIKECYLRRSIPLIVVLMAGLWLFSAGPALTWLELCARGVIIIAMYLLVALLCFADARAFVFSGARKLFHK